MSEPDSAAVSRIPWEFISSQLRRDSKEPLTFPRKNDSFRDWQCKYLMYCIFPVLKPLACGRQSRCLGWTYKLRGGKKISSRLSLLSVGFPQRRPLNLIKRPRFINSPGVRFINHPACSLKTTPFLLYKLVEKCRWKTFKRPERGNIFSNTFRIVFRIFLRVFQTVFRVSRAVPFCRGAALRKNDSFRELRVETLELLPKKEWY